MTKTPVVLFIFKRSETLACIIESIREYSPTKVYLVADGPRNSNESILTDRARSEALSLIDWDCEVIKKFSVKNIGVYRNIGEGAQWVLSREARAIFLEDDNLPESTFFRYCDDLLARYENDSEVLWICGTNYAGDTSGFGLESYYFTHHLLPCGWASWSNKFLKHYDGSLAGLNVSSVKRMKATYTSSMLFRQELQTIRQTQINYGRNPSLVSWDRQMCFAVRSNKLYGIAPSKNQIRNIGADMHSEHGGISIDMEMTSRFCEVNTYPLVFPLIAPASKSINMQFEKQTSSVLLYPLKDQVKRYIGRAIKILMGLHPDDSLAMYKKYRRDR